MDELREALAFVPDAVVRALLAQDELGSDKAGDPDALPPRETVEVVVFFVDISGFTALTEL
jgi:class 3 adenylate cyclase